MAGRKARKTATPGADKSHTTIDSNKSIFSDFGAAMKKDWGTMKSLPDTYKAEKTIGGTADKFFKELGGGSLGKGVGKAGGYMLGGAMLYDALFD